MIFVNYDLILCKQRYVNHINLVLLRLGISMLFTQDFVFLGVANHYI